MDLKKIQTWKKELTHHLEEELLPFWTERCWDFSNGGYNTQFDSHGKDSGVDEKSLLAHMRMIYSLSVAHLYGHDPSGNCAVLAKKGVDFAINNYWDTVNGGFFWLFDRKNNIIIDKKIIYGQSFAIYALATYAKIFDNSVALEYAEKCFNLLQIYASETAYGGYLEMFEQDWTVCPTGSGGGDRKTLDVHMHLMEAFTALYSVSGKVIHRRKLKEIIEILIKKIIHPEYKTGIPQFNKNWEVAPQIKFDIVWGWDRFEDNDNQKSNALDNTSYGHNVEFFWLLVDSLKLLGENLDEYEDLFKTILTHAVTNGIDSLNGGVYVEGSHDGSKVYDMAKEFWQQAEFLIGMLTAYTLYKDERYLSGYENIHNFVMKYVIKHDVGEWLPLLTREGIPIWEHMSHSWKINYHSIRAAVLSIERLVKIIQMDLDTIPL